MKLKVIIYNLLFLLLGVMALELTFGGWLNPNSLNALNLVRNAQWHFDPSDLYPTDGVLKTYQRDAYALRGPCHEIEKIDILTIGGSTTDQRYLGDGETWQDFLALAFHQDGQKLCIVNAGVDGQSSVGHLQDFRDWFPRIPNFKARFILAYVGINDLFTQAGYTYDDLTAAHSLKATIQAKSALYHLYRTLLGTYLARAKYGIGHRKVDFAKRAWTQQPVSDAAETWLKPRLDAYAKRLKALAEAIGAFGAQPVFVTQTSRTFRQRDGVLEGTPDVLELDGHTINGVDLAHLFDAMNAVTLSVCQKIQGTCLDLAGELKFDDADFYDDYHNTPLGARKVGEYLHEHLKNVMGNQ